MYNPGVNRDFFIQDLKLKIPATFKQAQLIPYL